MSEKLPKPTDAPPSAPDAEWDLDAEWDAARAATRRARLNDPEFAAAHPARPPAEISAYALLYTGFLLGPLASLIGVLVLMGRRFKLRTFVFALGICGASWCIAQGATFGLRTTWTPIALQTLRTTLNFSTGVILLGFVLKRTNIYLLHNRRVWVNTGIFFLLLLVVSTSLSPELLFWLGR